MADGKRRRKLLVLPSDVVSEILLRLPVQSLKRIKCVCKPWNDLISDSSFVKEHANRAKNCTNRLKVLVSTEGPAPLSIDYEDLLKHEEGYGHASTQLKIDISSNCSYEHASNLYLINIVGSCNGLICLHGVGRISHHPRAFVVVWNPSTGDTSTLPAPRFLKSRNSILPKLFGFGYDSSTEDYKVMLGNMSSSGTECITKIHLFSLKTGSWRCYEESRRIESNEYVKMGGQGCLSNGALHWIELVFDSRRRLDGSRSRIVAFDLAEEKFREMASLSSFMGKEYLDKITVSSESSYIYIGIGITIENVWAMKECGIEKSWTKLLHIPLEILVPVYKDYLVREHKDVDIDMSDYLFPVHILEDGKVLMSCDQKKLVLYDPKENTKRTILETCLSSYAVVYVETLISPRIGGGADMISKQHNGEEEEASKKHAMTSCLNFNKVVLNICRKPWMGRTY
ncbi:hypothetical protein ACLB2K_067198 [Fragaria x ananassa]